MPEQPDFSRYELMVLHRLGTLETETRDMHRAVEELRVSLATLKSEQRTRTAILATGISLVVTLAGALLPHLIGT